MGFKDPPSCRSHRSSNLPSCSAQWCTGIHAPHPPAEERLINKLWVLQCCFHLLCVVTHSLCWSSSTISSCTRRSKMFADCDALPLLSQCLTPGNKDSLQCKTYKCRRFAHSPCIDTWPQQSYDLNVRSIICPSNVTSKDGFVALRHRMSFQYVCTCQQGGEFSFLQKKRQHSANAAAAKYHGRLQHLDYFKLGLA